MKDFTLYPEALELKQLGYPQNGYFAWYGHDGLHYDSEYIEEDFTYACCAAPTYSQAFRWFREKYKLKCCIIPLVCEQGYSDLYESRIHQEKHSISRIGNYKIYEEAELACLKKLIEIVKENQK